MIVHRRILAFMTMLSFILFLMIYVIQTKFTFTRNTNLRFTAVENPLDLILKKLSGIENTLDHHQIFQEYKQFRNKIEAAIPKIIKKESDDINPHVLIQPNKGNIHNKYKVLVLVSSNAPHHTRRESIRQAWGNNSMWSTKQSFKVFFVLGGTKDLETMNKAYIEAEKYKDILLEDIEESFYNLSFKVMIGLQWAHTNINYDFILKCDDDIFVQMDRLMSRVENNKDYGYFGQIMAMQPVMRNGRYAVSQAEHPKEHFDPYCSGGAFIISWDTVQKIIPLFNWFSPLKIDDAYIGHLVYQAGVKAFHEDGFHLWNNWCEYTNILIVSHPVKVQVCMDFLKDRSMIENGKLINDTIKNEKYAFNEEMRKKL